MTGEERERKMLEDQIARAKAEAEAAGAETVPAELQKKEGEKISLNLFGSAPPAAPAAGTGAAAEAGPLKPAASTSLSFGSLPSASGPTTIANPLKRPAPVNVFKTAKTPKNDSEASTGPMKQKQLSEVERLMQEDQARKANRPARGGYQGQAPRRG